MATQDFHFELGRSEGLAARMNTAERWLSRVERILGHSLDGNQERDGYSFDFALEAYHAGQTAEAYAASVEARC